MNDKLDKVSEHFRSIMLELGLDLNDESLKETPMRVAKMYVNELFGSLHKEPPQIKTFPNNEKYDQMVLMKDITVYSTCEHHFVPIAGKVHIAYIPGDRVIGLSKLVRVSQHFAAKPQLQERLTQEIGKYLSEKLKTESVAVIVDAKHFCCSMRGARDPNSSTITSYLGGVFREAEVRAEFFSLVK